MDDAAMANDLSRLSSPLSKVSNGSDDDNAASGVQRSQAQAQAAKVQALKAAKFSSVANKVPNAGFASDADKMLDGVHFRLGDMVWAKVKSHPWWPGQIYDPALASSLARKSKRDACSLVAFFGDSTFGWFPETELIHFEPNFLQKSKQTNAHSFQDAVQDALDEIRRRIELGLTCSCRKAGNSDVGKKKQRGLLLDRQLHELRKVFMPAKMLAFVKHLACLPLSAHQNPLLTAVAGAQAHVYRASAFCTHNVEFEECFEEFVPASDSIQFSSAGMQVPLEGKKPTRDGCADVNPQSHKLKLGKYTTKSHFLKEAHTEPGANKKQSQLKQKDNTRGEVKDHPNKIRKLTPEKRERFEVPSPYLEAIIGAKRVGSKHTGTDTSKSDMGDAELSQDAAPMQKLVKEAFPEKEGGQVDFHVDDASAGADFPESSVDAVRNRHSAPMYKLAKHVAVGRGSNFRDKPKGIAVNDTGADILDLITSCKKCPEGTPMRRLVKAGQRLGQRENVKEVALKANCKGDGGRENSKDIRATDISGEEFHGSQAVLKYLDEKPSSKDPGMRENHKDLPPTGMSGGENQKPEAIVKNLAGLKRLAKRMSRVQRVAATGPDGKCSRTGERSLKKRDRETQVTCRQSSIVDLPQKRKKRHKARHEEEVFSSGDGLEKVRVQGVIASGNEALQKRGFSEVMLERLGFPCQQPLESTSMQDNVLPKMSKDLTSNNESYTPAKPLEADGEPRGHGLDAPSGEALFSPLQEPCNFDDGQAKHLDCMDVEVAKKDLDKLSYTSSERVATDLVVPNESTCSQISLPLANMKMLNVPCQTQKEALSAGAGDNSRNISHKRKSLDSSLTKSKASKKKNFVEVGDLSGPTSKQLRLDSPWKIRKGGDHAHDQTEDLPLPGSKNSRVNSNTQGKMAIHIPPDNLGAVSCASIINIKAIGSPSVGMGSQGTNDVNVGQQLVEKSKDSEIKVTDLQERLMSIAASPFDSFEGDTLILVKNAFVKHRKAVHKTEHGYLTMMQELSGEGKSKSGMGKENDESSVAGVSDVNRPASWPQSEECLEVAGLSKIDDSRATAIDAQVAEPATGKQTGGYARSHGAMKGLKKSASSKKVSSSSVSLRPAIEPKIPVHGSKEILNRFGQRVKRPADADETQRPGNQALAAKKPVQEVALMMRFSQSSALPSEGQLGEIFVRFGQLNLAGTKVYVNRSLAQVVFRNAQDANAALKYAKGKPVFGKVPVNFWVRQIVHSRDVDSKLKESKPLSDAANTFSRIVDIQGSSAGTEEGASSAVESSKEVHASSAPRAISPLLGMNSQGLSTPPDIGEQFMSLLLQLSALVSSTGALVGSSGFVL